MATLTPAGLEQAAARLVNSAVVDDQFARLAARCGRTAPASRAARGLLTKTVAELVAEAFGVSNPHGTRPPVDVRLPGRLARILPDKAWRGYNSAHPASTQLYVAAAVLREWGWQNRPHHLRDRRGRRCICGAICTAVHLGVGTADTAHTAAGHVLAELRSRGWGALIGDWNQVGGRTKEQAIQLVEAAAQRALAAES
ncbi:hypothetical protein ACFUJR_14835 [Streptomyces sp. NPDC057271]|uniref:DUF6197 family protein n=1 Tax=unclassified Streptomyces TaxID=2593676 RepID=UPI0036297D7F